MTHTRAIKLLLLLMFLVGSSSLAIAGGEGCNSKKGHKELSAEALQNLDKDHSWHKFHESEQAGKASKPEKQEANSNSGLIES